MTGLKDWQTGTESILATLKATLAKKQKELLEKQKELKKTEEEKAALEAYLLKIKPGCDFITENIDKRSENRATEKGGLEKAIELLKGTPAYTQAMHDAEQKALGKCKDTCNEGAEHVNCKSCKAKVSVPGYCAGHPGTAGC